MVQCLQNYIETQGRRWRTRAASEGMHGIITPAVISRSLIDVSVLNGKVTGQTYLTMNRGMTFQVLSFPFIDRNSIVQTKNATDTSPIAP